MDLVQAEKPAKPTDLAKQKIHALLDDFLEERNFDALIYQVGETMFPGGFSFRVTMKYNKEVELEFKVEGEMRAPKYSLVMAGEIRGGRLSLW